MTRHALAGDGAVELADLARVHQQFARPFRLVVEAVAVAEFGDVGVDQPHLPVLQLGIGLGDRPLALAQRLDLGPGERDPRLDDVVDEIFIARAAVLGDDLGLDAGRDGGAGH